jgi:hypothetical protein
VRLHLFVSGESELILSLSTVETERKGESRVSVSPAVSSAVPPHLRLPHRCFSSGELSGSPSPPAASSVPEDEGTSTSSCGVQFSHYVCSR